MKVDNPFAQFGAPVICVDADAKKIQSRPATGRTNDAVQLPGDLRLFDEAIRLASVDASPRADEVARARGLFERGELGTDAARLADRILDSLLDDGMTPSGGPGHVDESLRAPEAALMSGCADPVLDAECPLAAATANLTAMVAAPPPASVADRRDMRRLADDIQRSTRRVRALGAAPSDLVPAMLPPGTCGPRGLQPTAWSTATVAART